MSTAPFTTGALVSSILAITGLCPLEARPGFASEPALPPTTPPVLTEARPTGTRPPQVRPPQVRLTAHDNWVPDSGASVDDALDRARVHAKAGEWEESAAAFGEHFAGTRGRGLDHQRYGEVLLELDRRDEAAVQFNLCLRLLLDEGRRKSSAEYKEVRDLLREVDPVAQKREACENKVMNLLVPAVTLLVENEHWEYALDFLQRLVPLATGNKREELSGMLEEVEKVFSTVQLDEAGSGESSGSVRIETKYYTIVADLERPVAELVGDTMDDVFESYIQIYVDGDRGRLFSNKATIRIHKDQPTMLEDWQGDSQVGGWWSPMEQKVVCYDTRTDAGTLDAMLETLFHEASHQFMTMLSLRGGGSSPAWINEGTASFFEGATAMADRRVLWPDAARQRLVSLTRFRNIGEDLSVDQVLAFAEPGSYPGEYYAYGWGLVYYLQQYEDPDSLEYVWRPFYSKYLRRITSEDIDPLVLFEEVMLAPGNPGGFEDVNQFAEAWKDWILNQVLEDHFGEDRRARRLDRVRRYLEGADTTSSEAHGEDLLKRALRNAEFIRTQIDDEENPQGEILLLLIEIFSRLERGSSEAAMIEQLLDLADAGLHSLTERQYEQYEERMKKIDKANEHPRAAKARARNLREQARAVLEAYEELEPPLPRRSADFARLFGDALGDRLVLLPAADRLEASLAGAANFSGQPVAGGTWRSIFRGTESAFEHGSGRVAVQAEGDPAGRVCMDVDVEGSYFVRGQLLREGESGFRSSHGVVVSGQEDGPWLVVKIGSRGRIHVEAWTLEDGEPESDTLTKIVLDEPVEEGEHPAFEVLVDPAGSLRIALGAREPVEYELESPFEFPAVGHVGVFVEDARCSLVGLKVEPAP